MKFAHMADCHLGGWRIPALQDLNFASFKKAFDISINEGVEFVLIAGDLFDSAYPPIETLKATFEEFRRLKEAGIPCFLIAGSHDYSASGKTFLDVLEKAGLCTNVFNPEERGELIFLNPSIHKNVAIYGYPGQKSGMEVGGLRKVKLQEAPGLYKIFMLHTSLKSAIGTLPIDSLDETQLPTADYYALGHLHINFKKDNFIYSGPIFPNNFQELEELKVGSFYIVNTESFYKPRRIELSIKDVVVIEIELNDSFAATENIISEISKHSLENKIVMLKLSGKLQRASSKIRFQEIEDFVNSKKVFAFLRNISKLVTEEPQQIRIEATDMEKIEKEVIKKYCQTEKSDFNSLIEPLTNILEMSKKEDEKSIVFEMRLLDEVKKLLKF